MGYEFNRQYEDEFIAKCEEIAMYQPEERVTFDGQWKYGELRDDVFDECYKIIPTFHKKYFGCAMLDADLIIPTVMAEKIISENDIIDKYNEAVAKDNSAIFGIIKFDRWLHTEIKRLISENLVSK